MEYSNVTALLGNPDNCTESMDAKSYIWEDDSKNITVNFLGNKAIVFSSTGIK